MTFIQTLCLFLVLLIAPNFSASANAASVVKCEPSKCTCTTHTTPTCSNNNECSCVLKPGYCNTASDCSPVGSRCFNNMCSYITVPCTATDLSRCLTPCSSVGINALPTIQACFGINPSTGIGACGCQDAPGTLKCAKATDCKCPGYEPASCESGICQCTYACRTSADCRCGGGGAEAQCVNMKKLTNGNSVGTCKCNLTAL